METMALPQERVDLFGQAESLTAYVEAYAVHDAGDGPALVAFAVDKAFVERLSRLHDVCVQNDLCEVRADAAPDWGPYGIEDDLRLENHELVVTGLGRFWYRAAVVHADYHVESRLLSIGEFVDRCRSALAEGKAYLVCGEWGEEDPEAVIAAYRDAKAAADAGFGMTV